jgi:hypothetical protein
MEKIEKYKQIVREVQAKIAAPYDESVSIKDVIIQDNKGGHYLILSDGWEGSSRSYGIYFHVDVNPDGKVWLQYDGTDSMIGQQLLDQGVAKEDLVLGWIAPYRRADTGFAVG